MYAIRGIDFCSDTSLLMSNPHTTIYLDANLRINKEINLSWNSYVGFDINAYIIIRNGDSLSSVAGDKLL